MDVTIVLMDRTKCVAVCSNRTTFVDFVSEMIGNIIYLYYATFFLKILSDANQISSDVEITHVFRKIGVAMVKTIAKMVRTKPTVLLIHLVIYLIRLIYFI